MEAGSSAAEGSGSAGTGRTGGFRDEAEHAAREAAGAARREAGDLLDTLKHQARELVDEQKEMAADQIHGVAEALRRASEELSAQHNRMMSDAVRRTAESVDDVAGCVRSESVGDLYRHAENFSRRHPAVVIGGAAAAAFLFARFLRASGGRGSGEDYLEFEESADEVGRPY